MIRVGGSRRSPYNKKQYTKAQAVMNTFANLSLTKLLQWI